jgi:uncharacterized protein (TIGR04255 family)
VLSTGAPPLARHWFIDQTKTKLIQLQCDRFLFNWRKITGKEPYPRYEELRDDFFRQWDQFCHFCEREKIGQPIVQQGELTYVNHILKDTCWKATADAPEIFSFLSDKKNEVFQGDYCEYEALNCNFQFVRTENENQSRLHVGVVPAIRVEDKQQMLRMNLTVRGAVRPEKPKALEKWFDSSRFWIVRWFELMTTKKAHDYWKRIS